MSYQQSLQGPGLGEAESSWGGKWPGWGEHRGLGGENVCVLMVPANQSWASYIFLSSRFCLFLCIYFFSLAVPDLCCYVQALFERDGSLRAGFL